MGSSYPFLDDDENHFEYRPSGFPVKKLNKMISCPFCGAHLCGTWYEVRSSGVYRLTLYCRANGQEPADRAEMEVTKKLELATE